MGSLDSQEYQENLVHLENLEWQGHQVKEDNQVHQGYQELGNQEKMVSEGSLACLEEKVRQALLGYQGVQVYQAMVNQGSQDLRVTKVMPVSLGLPD